MPPPRSPTRWTSAGPVDTRRSAVASAAGYSYVASYTDSADESGLDHAASTVFTSSFRSRTCPIRTCLSSGHWPRSSRSAFRLTPAFAVTRHGCGSRSLACLAPASAAHCCKPRMSSGLTPYRLQQWPKFARRLLPSRSRTRYLLVLARRQVQNPGFELTVC